MTLTAAFAAELDELGIWRPTGDADALRASADAWRSAADLLEDVALVLDTAAMRVVEHHRGEAATRFATLWSRWNGERGHLAATVEAMRRIAVAVEDFATDVDVADRALLRLIEQVLEANPAGLLGLIDELWRAWLGEQADVLADDLAVAADGHAGAVAEVADRADVAALLGPDDAAAVDPTAVTWPAFGPPVDLSHLATTSVDFGAGPGRDWSGLDPVAGLPTPGGPVVDPADQGPDCPGAVGHVDCPTPITPAGGWSPTVPGWPWGGGVAVPDGCPPTTGWPTMPVAPPWTVPGTPGWQPAPYEPTPWEPPAFEPTTSQPEPFRPTPWEPPAFEPSEWEPASFEPTTWEPSRIDVTPPASVAVDGAGGDLLGDLDPLAGLDSDVVDAGPGPSMISIDPPGHAVAAGAVGAGALGAAAAGGRGRMPFFPFMPMGGMGGGGDEQNEPKRRVPRRHTTPLT